MKTLAVCVTIVVSVLILSVTFFKVEHFKMAVDWEKTKLSWDEHKIWWDQENVSWEQTKIEWAKIGK